MSLLDDVKRARGENTTQAQQQFTTSTSSSSNSLLQRVKIARGELQPQSPVVQPTAPTQTFTQKVGGFISGAAEKTKTLVSTGFQKLIGDNDTILQLSQDDLLKRIYKAKMSGQDASNMQKTLLAINEAQKPEASPLKKITTGLAVRTMRAGVQLQSSAAGFGASLLDSITQITERRLKDDIKILESNPLYKPEEIQKIKDKPIKTREISNAIKKWSDETRVDNPVFAEKVVEGAGSMIGYTMIALATKSASPLTYNLLESLTESGSVYEEQRKKGKSIEEASKSADITLVGNLVVNRFLNIFDAKYEQLKPIQRAFQNAGIEGAQEAAQQIISNVTTDRPWYEGVLEAAGIGATLGGITTVALPSGEMVTLDENTKKITKVEPGKPPVIIQPQKVKEELTVTGKGKEEEPVEKPLSPTDRGEVIPGLKEEVIVGRGEAKQDPLEALKTEARKYKSAEEFVQRMEKGRAKWGTSTVRINPVQNAIDHSPYVGKPGKKVEIFRVTPGNIEAGDFVFTSKVDAEKYMARQKDITPGTIKSMIVDSSEIAPAFDMNTQINNRYIGTNKYKNIKPGFSSVESIYVPKEVQGKSLTDIYNQATAEKKQSKPEVKKPAKKKTPDRDNKFTSRVFERLQEENKDLTGELLVDRVRLQEDAEKAVDLIAKDKQKAYRIAMGEEKSDAITSTATNIALAEEALREGNTKLYADLVKNRSIAQTRRGQEISAERGSITDNSTSRYVKELLSIRLENVGRSYLKDLQPGKATNKEKANNVIDRKVSAFEKKVKANKIDVKTALKLLDEITCI